VGFESKLSSGPAVKRGLGRRVRVELNTGGKVSGSWIFTAENGVRTPKGRIAGGGGPQLLGDSEARKTMRAYIRIKREKGEYSVRSDGWVGIYSSFSICGQGKRPATGNYKSHAYPSAPSCDKTIRESQNSGTGGREIRHQGVGVGALNSGMC